MTNYEKYKDWFNEHRDEFLCSEEHLAVVEGKPTFCDLCVICGNCKFNNTDGKSCADQRKEWLNEEYVIDWSKEPIDTKVVVSSIKGYKNAYFAGVSLAGYPMVFKGGKTSFTSDGIMDKVSINHDSIRLYEE